MSTQPPKHPDTPASEAPAVVPDDPAAALADIGINSRHPEALRLAPKWSAILRSLACGTDVIVACRMARVPRQTMYSWLRFGRGFVEKNGTAVPPREPFDEFAFAYDEARSTPETDAWEAVTSAARDGNVLAARLVIERRQAQRTAVERSKLAKAQTNGQILANRLRRRELEVADVKAELARVELELARKKLDGTHVETHAVITDPNDPRWAALQREVFGHERQGVADAQAAAALTDDGPTDGDDERDPDPDDVVA